MLDMSRHDMTSLRKCPKNFYFKCQLSALYYKFNKTSDAMSTLCVLLQETAMTEVDNNLSKQQLEISNVTSRINRLKETIDGYNKSISQMNSQISKSESEIVRNNALVERKQTQIDQLNKKIDLHISKLDGVSTLGLSGCFIKCFRMLGDCFIRVLWKHLYFYVPEVVD